MMTTRFLKLKPVNQDKPLRKRALLLRVWSLPKLLLRNQLNLHPREIRNSPQRNSSQNKRFPREVRDCKNQMIKNQPRILSRKLKKIRNKQQRPLR